MYFLPEKKGRFWSFMAIFRGFCPENFRGCSMDDQDVVYRFTFSNSIRCGTTSGAARTSTAIISWVRLMGLVTPWFTTDRSEAPMGEAGERRVKVKQWYFRARTYTTLGNPRLVKVSGSLKRLVYLINLMMLEKACLLKMSFAVM